MKKILIFGGSGFIGRYIVKELAEDSHIIKIISRSQAKELKVCGEVGQITCVNGNVSDEELVEKHTLGMDIVINLVGILYESYSKEFNFIHNIAAKNIAKYAKTAKVKQLIHFSALGIENQSQYNESKLNGENIIKKEFPDAVIIRPSVVFGEEDNFFNKFARFATISPFLPIIGGGKGLMQPVFVGDVARFIRNIVTKKITKQTYELAGPKKYSFKELMEFIIKTIERKRRLVNIKFSIAKFTAWFLEFRLISLLLKPMNGSNSPILTRDQVDLLRYDNVSNKDSLQSAGIIPKTIEEVVTQYLQRYKKHN
ncbi:MAG: complex I NDUFA9 subunit family protein [Rickettsiaceae bacterium H1]|nr:complex I NDUFA9 subunit family protein [Rickettsiaceae bacterium H1]